MPLSDHECPNCNKELHSDDQIEGRCIGEPIGTGCNEELPEEMKW